MARLFMFGPDNLSAEEILNLSKSKKKAYVRKLKQPELVEYLSQSNKVRC